VQQHDVVVVGGGPAGSTCAWKLRQAGLDVLVLDREKFPRTKLCAGWVTPEAMHDLELSEADYPPGFITLDELVLHWKVLTVRHESRQYSIRRYEFDDFLLRRSNATVVQHKVRNIEKVGAEYVVDGEYRCRFVVGAGGTSCPVYKSLFHDRNPRAGLLQTATLEQEFAYEWHNPDCHLWFFNDGLPGYAWYVPKSGGYINVGLGGMAEKIKLTSLGLRDYWTAFTEMLRNKNLVSVDAFKPRGYSYFLRGQVDTVRIDNAFVVGDSVGLATRDMCEGIGPAVKSGLLAADAIISGSEYTVSGIAALSGQSFVSRALEKRFAGAA